MIFLSSGVFISLADKRESVLVTWRVLHVTVSDFASAHTRFDERACFSMLESGELKLYSPAAKIASTNTKLRYAKLSN
jgi:hypothetical protein